MWRELALSLFMWSQSEARGSDLDSSGYSDAMMSCMWWTVLTDQQHARHQIFTCSASSIGEREVNDQRGVGQSKGNGLVGMVAHHL